MGKLGKHRADFFLGNLLLELNTGVLVVDAVRHVFNRLLVGIALSKSRSLLDGIIAEHPVNVNPLGAPRKDGSERSCFQLAFREEPQILR